MNPSTQTVVPDAAAYSSLPRAPHPADVETRQLAEKLVERHQRYLTVRRLGMAAYRAGFEKLWPGEWGGA